MRWDEALDSWQSRGDVHRILDGSANRVASNDSMGFVYLAVRDWRAEQGAQHIRV